MSHVPPAANDKRNMGRFPVTVALLFLSSAVWAQDDGSAGTVSRPLDTMSLEELMQVKVQGAALHSQTLQDAPASVTIITAEEIRKYGYRTLGEALASARGFYLDNNRTYETIGVRGFGAPDDYSSHVLIMVNGHTLNDNIYSYVLFLGNDFPIDMNLVKQIEIIRGPSSALYGTNGMFATINIVTKSPEEADPAAMAATFDSFGERKGEITGTASAGKDAKVLLSGSVYNNSGESPLYFPQFNTPQANNGNATDMNGERGYHFFSNFTSGNWSVLAVFSGADKIQPISWGATIFNNRGTQNYDTRNFIDAAYSRQLKHGALYWRSYYDEQRYLGRFEYPLDAANPYSSGADDNRTLTVGNWIGSELRYRIDVHGLGTITAGVEAKIDLQAFQGDRDIFPVPYTHLSTNHRDNNQALFVQDEVRLSARWTLDLGARMDRSHLLHDFVSPRAALIYQARSGWTYKFLYGRSFRNPSEFQLYYGDQLSGIANPSLRPENSDTVEADAERRIGKKWNLVTAAYGYLLRDYIDGIATGPLGVIQYQNLGKIRAGGIEMELNGRPQPWLEVTGSYAIQRTKDLGDGGVLENSPEHLAKLRFAFPVGPKLELRSGIQYSGPVVSVAQAAVPDYYLADFTLTSRKLLRNFDFTLGIRNAFNRSYYDPIALNPVVDTMPQPGRSIFVELIPHRAR